MKKRGINLSHIKISSGKLKKVNNLNEDNEIDIEDDSFIHDTDDHETKVSCFRCDLMILFISIIIFVSSLYIYFIVPLEQISMAFTSDQHIHHIEAIQSIVNNVNRIQQKFNIDLPVLNDVSLIQSEDTKKKLIMGIAHNIDSKNLVVFCGSIYSIIQDDSLIDVILFINSPISQRNRDIFLKYSIIAIEYSSEKIDIFQSYHPSTLRWILMYNYLINENQYMKYSQILLIDVRDSYFQLNPFPSSSFDSYLNVYEGVSSVTISQCGWNSGWIKDCFGKDILDDIGHENIICSGVTMGTTNKIVDYLHLMYEIVRGNNSFISSHYHIETKFPICERNGVDQGAHNVIVHKKLIDSSIIPQSHSIVINMQAKIARVIEDPISHEFIIRNSMDEKVAIIHQYDRDSRLQEYLFKKYIYWLDASEPKELWNEDKICQNFIPSYDVDLFKGICDFKMQGGASTAATCCKVCQEFVDSCLAFTFYSGVCYLKNCGINASKSSTTSGLKGAVTAYRQN